ncbi:hypothetical protein COLO4_25565 [Corchorus olitorius]|uniref:Uncharacterized protein n=1 Tax=Corchorus olitorius TaxID=93759 RepID=A0A1R3I1F2_9ROSI|nr:hypothetical protein COLO4_25565 [Corchorus olitorius]
MYVVKLIEDIHGCAFMLVVSCLFSLVVQRCGARTREWYENLKKQMLSNIYSAAVESPTQAPAPPAQGGDDGGRDQSTVGLGQRIATRLGLARGGRDGHGRHQGFFASLGRGIVARLGLGRGTAYNPVVV